MRLRKIDPRPVRCWRWALLVIATLAALTAAGRPAAAAPELTLPQALDRALANNPKVERAAARIAQARAALAEAESAFWPQVSLFTEYMQGDAPSGYLFKKIDQRQLPPNTNFNDPGWFENWEAGAEARLNLYNGGRDRLRRQMAQKEVAISRLADKNVRNELAAAVIDTFYAALVAQRFIEIADQAVATVGRQLELMKVRYEAGGVLKSDLLSLEVRLARAREDRITAANNYDRLLAALANALGDGPETSYRPVESAMPDFEPPVGYEAAFGYALEHRPELARVRRQLELSHLGLDEARSGYLPRLDLQSRYYHDDPDFMDYDEERENWTLGLMLNWEIFAGFRTAARVDRAAAAIRELEAADRETAQAIGLELKTALLDLEEAEARQEVSRRSVEQAEESLRLVTIEYEGGSATVTRYLNAELARDRARLQAVQADYDRRRALTNLARAMGHWSGLQAGGEEE